MELNEIDEIVQATQSIEEDCMLRTIILKWELNDC